MTITSMEPVTTAGKRRIAKPLGVSVICLFDGIVIGLFPLILLIVLDRDPKLEISLLNYALTAIVDIAVVAAALGAFRGENAGRVALLSAVTFHSLLVILNSVALLSGDDARRTATVAIGNVTRGLFWIGINWWYFNRKEVLAYYRQNRSGS